MTIIKHLLDLISEHQQQMFMPTENVPILLQLLKLLGLVTVLASAGDCAGKFHS